MRTHNESELHLCGAATQFGPQCSQNVVVVVVCLKGEDDEHRTNIRRNMEYQLAAQILSNQHSKHCFTFQFVARFDAMLNAYDGGFGDNSVVCFKDIAHMTQTAGPVARRILSPLLLNCSRLNHQNFC